MSGGFRVTYTGVKTTYPKATKTVYPIICQIVNVIPSQFVAQTAAEHKVVSRTFSPKSHVAAMFYCQVSKTESLNSICDIAQANETLRLYGTASPVKSPAAKPKRLVFQLVFDFAPAGMGQQTC